MGAKQSSKIRVETKTLLEAIRFFADRDVA